MCNDCKVSFLLHDLERERRKNKVSFSKVGPAKDLRARGRKWQVDKDDNYKIRGNESRVCLLIQMLIHTHCFHLSIIIFVSQFPNLVIKDFLSYTQIEWSISTFGVSLSRVSCANSYLITDLLLFFHLEPRILYTNGWVLTQL